MTRGSPCSSGSLQRSLNWMQLIRGCRVRVLHGARPPSRSRSSGTHARLPGLPHEPQTQTIMCITAAQVMGTAFTPAAPGSTGPRARGGVARRLRRSRDDGHHESSRLLQRRRRDRTNNRSSHGLSTRRGEGFRPRLRTRSRARLPRGEGLRRRPVEGLLQEAAHELEVVDRDAVQRRRVIGRARRRVVGRVRVGHGHR